jgi:hypothetical protein
LHPHFRASEYMSVNVDQYWKVDIVFSPFPHALFLFAIHPRQLSEFDMKCQMFKQILTS